MKLIAFCLLSLIIAGCQFNKEQPSLYPLPLPNDKAALQQQVVGHLSGKLPLADGQIIKARWSESERKLAKDYLIDLLEALYIEPKEQEYVRANNLAVVDLLVGPFTGTNVYGVLPATEDTDEYVVLGAHYDSGKRNAPGAVDNATGIALIISVVKQLAKTDRNKHLMVVFFDQEEEEQIGSRAFIDLIKEKGWNIGSVHCFDMVGWDGDGDQAMEVFSPSEELLGVYRKHAQADNIPLKEIKIDPVGYENGATDFDVFVPAGFHVIGGGECVYHGDYSPYKDTPKDTFETVNFPYLFTCSKVVAGVISELIKP